MDKEAQFEWIVRNVKNYIKEDIQTKTSTIRIKLLSETKVKIAYLTARHARIRCLEDMYDSFEESFRLLLQLCSEIRDNNPGSIVTLISHEKNKQFEGLCIAYKASLQVFQDGCRPVIALESSPLREKYGGAVLSVTSIDANNGMFPVNIYICMYTCFVLGISFFPLSRRL
ncbi:hypothetical protein MKW98_006645 [Papaver atlanticum]|uniref:Uncharacterized protein n=1 Tax=Papaver atlanticum TaxID=357466 RepID=A0AAD4T2I6_9MAGN|nr:hypothetical protein MKW98_006645 [Papaver atlanticum]